MVKKKYLLISGLLVIIGIATAITVFPNEERRVKKRFNLLTAWVAKSPEENLFTMLQKMKNIGTLFFEPCELIVPDQSLSGSYARQEISTYVGSARSHFSKLDLKFYDLHILFPEKEVAHVTLTGRLIGKFRTGDQVDEIRELDCFLRKIEKEWLFSRIEVVEVLKR